MSGSSIIRRFSLVSFAALLLAGLASPGFAGGNHGEAPPIDQQYSGPAFLRHIPGIRILFGDYALTEDQYNQLYGPKKKKKIDESYYEPQPAKPKVKPGLAKPSTTTTTATPPANSANPSLPQKTAAATPAKPAGGPLSCEKATEVVSGFGFSSVEASSCSGSLYAFNAKRGGKSFAIKLNPATGELTEVKKLP